MDDPDLMFSLRIFIRSLGSTQHNYELVRQTLEARDPRIKMLSYLWKLSGVVTWEHPMCNESCAGFTGPFKDLRSCPECGAPQPNQEEPTDDKIPPKAFTTFPVGPQLQARWNNFETAKKMLDSWDNTEDIRHQWEASGISPEILDDILSGGAYLDAVKNTPINKHDPVLVLSIDGAQLYRNKKSNCWMYIWILLNLGPDERYKIRSILPGGIIPGPKHPKNLDSFLLPGLAHVAALQKEGLPVWDAYNHIRVVCFIYLFLVLADAVAMASVSGAVGHHGRKGCRLLCGFAGRNKAQGSHYYPALLRPDGFENHPTSSHPDIDVNDVPDPDPATYWEDLKTLISSAHETQLGQIRRDTGIGKPSIFHGIPRILDLPTCFGGDLMHQPVINMAALFLDLWCARPDARDFDRSSVWPWAVLVGDTWKKHGAVVAKAARYLPTSFGRVPRNPQEKVSSGYKAQEFLYYLYGLGPGVFFNLLPEPYYSHFCKLVRGIRLIYQRTLSKQQLIDAHTLLLQWVSEFESIYYQRKPERLHFVRQCVHSLAHLAKETYRLGPLCLSAQWTMERVIGYLGSLLRQPSNIFRHLAAQSRRLAYVNAMVALWPEFLIEEKDPRGSKDLGEGYLLLGPTDTTLHHFLDAEQTALDIFCSGATCLTDVDSQSVYRWGRLQLPCGQIARSCMKEVERCPNMARTDRNVKVRLLITSF